MIDLREWRRARSRHYKGLALCIVGTCYMLIVVPALIYLPGLYRTKKEWSAQVAKREPNQQVLSKTTAEAIASVNQLVWAKHRFVLGLIRRLTAIPLHVELMSLVCQQMICEFNVAGQTAQELVSVFARNQLRDLKQGGCPLCYHAKIDVRLS